MSDYCGTPNAILSIAVLLATIVMVVGIGYLIVHNTQTFQKECEAKNMTMWQSYNDTECGCKWYNLCDHGCLVCKPGNYTWDGRTR